MTDEGLYLPDGHGFRGTPNTQGAWDPHTQSGGAVLALLGHVLEDVPTLVPMGLARMTVDLVRPVPIGRRLDVHRDIVREGKRIQVVDLIVTVDDTEYVRARGLRLREEDVSDWPALPASTTGHDPAAAMPRPDDPAVVPLGHGPGVPAFLRHGAELRRAPLGSSETYGMWMRLLLPVVAGEDVRPTSRLTLTMDFANIIGVHLDPRRTTAINPDVTAHVLRPPTGEWTGLLGDTRFAHQIGRGISVVTMSDMDGVFGFSSTSQLVAPVHPR